MIRATLYLPDGTVRTFEAVNNFELVQMLDEYGRYNLITMLASAVQQISKKNSQLLTLKAMAERIAQ